MKLLIVAYQFCPKGKIGTRRWSKFAKYLAKEGHEVHVVSAAYPHKDKVNWCHDVENNPNIIIHRLPARFPTFTVQTERTFWVKLADRVAKNTLYYLDPAQQWGSVMIPFVTELIQKESISNVMVTAAPFMPFYFMGKVKQQLPHINLILDLRDPWDYFLQSNLAWFNDWRKKVALQKERFAFEQADRVLIVTDLLRKQTAERHKHLSDKMFTLFNGFDADDFATLDSASVHNFQVVYPGSLMSNRATAIRLMTEAIHELNDDFINKNLIVNIYSHNFVPLKFEDKSLQATFDRHFKKHPVVSPQEIFGIMQQHEFCMSINAPKHANAIGAKTFDYMGLNKKILLISPEGELSKMLRASQQFVSDYSPAQMKTTLLQMKQSHIERTTYSNTSYQKYALAHLTNELMGYLKKPNQ